MKETEFIEQNKNKWASFEKSLSSSSAKPEEVRELYTELNNDLSYAQTFYEKRMVRSYLNNLTQSIHRKLYKQKKDPFSAVLKTWTVDLPLEIYRARKNLLFALVLFVIYALIGAFSVHQDIGFASQILGNHYILSTEENIASGNPMGIYGNSSQGIMFLQITLNNIKVALMCFVGGLLFSVGTHIILFQNAVMLGVFQYFFKLKGLLLTSFLTIWIHGAFEISAIIIASGAGFTLGHGLLFPGSYTRLQSLQMSGMRGIRMMLSLIPIFVVAGFLESYVTRNYQTLPDWSKWAIVLFSFGFILFYYILYPILVARKYPEKVHATTQVNVFDKIKFEPYKLRKNIEIFRETWQIYIAKFSSIGKRLMLTAVPIISVLMIFQVYYHFYDMDTYYTFDWAAQLSLIFGNPLDQNFNGLTDVIASIVWIVPISLIALSTFYVFHTFKEDFKLTFSQFVRQRILKMIAAIFPAYFLFMVLPYFILIPLAFLLPFLILLPASVGLEDKPTLKTGFLLSSSKWSSSFILFSVFVITVFLIAQPFAFVFSFEQYNGKPFVSDLLDMFTDFLIPIFNEVTDFPMVWANIIRQVVYVSFMLLVLPLFFLAFGLIFYTATEEQKAIGLNNEFKNFGTRSRTKETPADFE